MYAFCARTQTRRSLADRSFDMAVCFTMLHHVPPLCCRTGC
jgi:hypothetical protein